jgi:apolipoprotein N-acyltransferase
MFFNGEGEMQYTYLKSKIVPGDNDKAGDGIIKYTDTSYGRVGSAICFDADFPQYIRQAGEDNIDIFLLPSSDWKAIDPIHTQMAVFRAIENGFSIVRQVQEGYSLSADYLGSTISSMDYFNSDNRVLISQVPIERVKTIYSSVGDVFAWGCMIAFLIIIIIYIRSCVNEKF